MLADSFVNISNSIFIQFLNKNDKTVFGARITSSKICRIRYVLITIPFIISREGLMQFFV